MTVQLSVAHLSWPLIAENKDYRGFFFFFSSLVSGKSTKIYKQLNNNHILLFIAISLQGFFSVGIFLVVKFRQIENFFF